MVQFKYRFTQRLSQDEPIIPAQILEPPSLPNHSSLPGAASILELKHENNRGRFVIANKPVKVGDVLFSELPYASILLPEHYSSHCHHCVSKFSMVFCFQNCPHLLWEKSIEKNISNFEAKNLLFFWEIYLEKIIQTVKGQNNLWNRILFNQNSDLIVCTYIGKMKMPIRTNLKRRCQIKSSLFRIMLRRVIWPLFLEIWAKVKNLD